MYQLMPGYQSAYRKNFSCETAIIKITNDILWSMESKKITSLTYIDLSAAFDTVDHGILLNVLQNKFGISGKALSWFKSYLQPRFCRVNIHDANSEDKELKFLVPQGSCAGPVLYSAYASTLQEVVPLDLHGYADNHGLKTNFFPVPEYEAKAIADTEKCLTDIKTWMDQNRLCMNNAKTKFILFGSRQQLKKCLTKNLSANGEEISQSKCIKYLGTWMDQELSFRQHIMNKCRLAMLNIQWIKLIRNILNEDTTHTLVLSLVMSHLDYCNAIFYGLPEVDLKRLQRVQNVAAKLVLSKSCRDSVTKCMLHLHWLPIKSRIEYKILILTHKCVYGEAPKYLTDLITKWGVTWEGLRSAEMVNMLEVPYTKCKTFGARSFESAAPHLWNNLPNEIRGIWIHETFKKSIKTYLFKSTYGLI